MRLRSGLVAGLGIASATAIAAIAETVAPVALERALVGRHAGIDITVATCHQRWLSATCRQVRLRGQEYELTVPELELRFASWRLHATLHDARIERSPQKALRQRLRRAKDRARTTGTARTAAKTPAPTRDRLPFAVTMTLADPLTLALTDGLELRVGAADITIARDRSVELRAAARLRSDGDIVLDLPDLVAEGGAAARDGWTVSGGWATHEAEGRLRAAWNAGNTEVDLVDDQGGRLALSGSILDPRTTDASQQPAQLRLRATNLRGATLASLLPQPFDRGSQAWREAVNLEPLIVDGDVVVTRATGWHVLIHELAVRSLELRIPKLASEPVVLERFGLSGEIRWTRSKQRADVRLAIQGADVELAVERTPDRLEARAELHELACEDLLEALPKRVRGIAAGMKLSGRVSAHAHLATPLPVSFDPASGDPPAGELVFDFPFTKACRVTADPPSLDLEALSGRFVHRFIDGTGHRQDMVLAPGAPGFVPLASIPTVANAFVTLEDARFWDHDGFDREQMERAFWYNMTRGGFARGASTITQQTARSLWLGVDRTLARKLQEALLTMRLEAVLPKRRILEIYLNIVELGPGIHGVERAARFYFGRSARELSALQAVHLASMAPAPVRYSRRFAHGRVDDEWRQELERQLERLRIHGYLGHAAARAAARSELQLRDRR